MTLSSSISEIVYLIAADSTANAGLIADIASYDRRCHVRAVIEPDLPLPKDILLFDDDRIADAIFVDWHDGHQRVVSLLQKQNFHCPVIALIDADQDLRDIAGEAYFDDFVTRPELTSCVFSARLQRLIDRYAKPLSTTTRSSPELGIIQTIANHADESILVKDLQHRFVVAGESFAKQAGYTEQQLIGMNDLEIGSSRSDVLGDPGSGWPGFWPQDDAAVESAEIIVEDSTNWQAYSMDTHYRQTKRVPLKNGKGDIYGLLVCISDITEAVQSEITLKDREERLELVTEEKKRAERSQQIAEQAVAAKNKFLAAASHDLRQPLHAMGLFLDVLERRLNNTEEAKIITKLKHSSDALSALFNSLLDISRLDAGVVEVEKTHFPIAELISNLREEHVEIGAAKGLSIRFCSSEHVLHTDAILLTRILRNLIQNAIEHTEHGSVEITCERIGRNLKLSVVDTGSGIPVSEQSAIFSEFYQLERQQYPKRGLGLGLAIVRRLSDLLKLNLELESDLNCGSRFSFAVPLGNPNKVIHAHDIQNPEQLSGYTVLIIDDELDICEGMAIMLRNYKCRTVTAESATVAVHVLTEQGIQPDLIVADYRLMHGKTGDTAIATIRDEFNCDIPAIIVTGDTSANRIKDATTSGFPILHKPVQPCQLVQTIATLLIPSDANRLTANSN